MTSLCNALAAEIIDLFICFIFFFPSKVSQSLNSSPKINQVCLLSKVKLQYFSETANKVFLFGLKIKYWYTKSCYTEIYSNILFYNFAISRAKLFLPLSFSLQFYHWINKTSRQERRESQSADGYLKSLSQQSGIIPRRIIVTCLQGSDKISRK